MYSLPSQQQIVPRSQAMVNSMMGWWPSLAKTGGWMMGCWRLEAIGSMTGEVRSKARWWDLSTILGFPLYSSQSTNCLSCHHRVFIQLTHRKIQRPTTVLTPLYCSFVMILTTPLCLWIYVLCLDFPLLQLHLIAPSFRDYDNSAYCQPHSGSTAYTLFIVIYF